jgi:hypothetical protein
MASMMRNHPAFLGLPIVDAKKNRPVVALLVDIKGACPNDPCDCPWARSLMREGARAAIVYKYRAYVLEEGAKHWLRYVNHWPEVIRQFDTEGRFVYGKLTLFAPTKAHRLGKRAPEKKRERTPGPKKPGRPRLSLRELPHYATKEDERIAREANKP